MCGTPKLSRVIVMRVGIDAEPPSCVGSSGLVGQEGRGSSGMAGWPAVVGLVRR